MTNQATITSAYISDLQDKTEALREAATSLDTFAKMLDPEIKAGKLVCGVAEVSNAYETLQHLIFSLIDTSESAKEAANQLSCDGLKALENAQLDIERRLIGIA